ncbi:MAG: hypothetical protein RI989_1551, partial [Bacteroidota bacterium]
LLVILAVLSLASCTLEKRVYSSGYHISWLHTVGKGVLQDASQDVAQDASQQLSQNLPKDLSSNLSSNLEIQTLSDTITPINKEEDYFGQKDSSSDQKEKTPFFSPPIRRPKTIHDLKISIGRDFKMVLTWISPSANGDGAVFFSLLLVASFVTFFFYLIRAIIRIFKLSALKALGKSDDTEINKNAESQPIRESEHQYARRFGLWFIRNLFDPWGRFKLALILAAIGLIVLMAITI